VHMEVGSGSPFRDAEREPEYEQYVSFMALNYVYH